MTYADMQMQAPPKPEALQTYEAGARVYAVGVILGAVSLLVAVGLIAYGLIDERPELAIVGASLASGGVMSLFAGVVGGQALRMLALIARSHGA